MNDRVILFVAVLCLLGTSLGFAQEPAYTSSSEAVWGSPYPGLGNVHPGSASVNSTAPTAITLYAEPPESNYGASELLLAQTPSNKLTKIIQKIQFDTLWAPASGPKGLGITELELAGTFGLPMPSPGSALLVTPKFAVDFLDAKETALRENETFYSTGADFRWILPICKNKLTADIGFGIFYNGDFRADSDKSFRFPARAIGIWNMNPRTKILFGIIYTDRQDDYTWLPMAGIIWTPNADLNIELLVPRLKIAQRIRWFGSGAGEEQSDWLYTAFEFDGGTWGYELPVHPSVSGEVEYSDLRLLMGYERRTRFGATLAFELGFMFERELELEHYFEQNLSDAVFLRLRSTF